MAEFGAISIIIALTTCVAAVLLLSFGLKTRSAASVRGGHFALAASFIFTAAASLALLLAFLSRDFSLSYVYNHSNRSLSPIFTAAAFWGGQEGSLLLWQFLTATFGSLFLIQGRKGRLNQHALLIIALIGLFFLVPLASQASPFKLMASPQSDGVGLNPLLIHLQMVFHPPLLFAGYAAASFPFALVLGALITGQSDGAWVSAAKKWALLAHIFLSLGILLGALWAYDELAFGGYWAFDPVENASLLPWLSASALLHSLNIHERRGSLKLWTVVLAILTFLSCLLATFITRSGIIESVHAFGRSPLAAYLMWVLIISTLASALLVALKSKGFASGEVGSLLSTEHSLHLNNLFLIFFMVVIVFGTFYPVITESLLASRISLGPIFFKRIIPPLSYIYVVFLGICPLLGGKDTDLAKLIKRAASPLLIAALIFSLAFFAWGSHLTGSLGLGIAAFAISVNLLTILTSPATLIKRIVANRSKYGGYLAHLGISIIFVGLIGTNLYPLSGQATLKRGESFQVGGLNVTNLGLKKVELAERTESIANISVSSKAGRSISLTPKLIHYKDFEMDGAKVAIKGGLFKDIYANLIKSHESGTIHLEIKINPFASWLWMGTYLLIAGALAAYWPKKRV